MTTFKKVDFDPFGAAEPVSGPQDFARLYAPAIQRASARLGVSPEVLTAQFGLETGWGKHVIPGTNNLGNIKDFSGGGVAATDSMTGSRDRYRQYSDSGKFADDFSTLIEKRYPAAIGAGNDAAKFATALKAGGYAEDPNYVKKIVSAHSMVTPSQRFKRVDYDPFAEDFSDVKSAVETKQKPSFGQKFAQEVRQSMPVQAARGLLRGAKDVIDTGAELAASGFDKLAGTNEASRVRAMNEDGKREFSQGGAVGDSIDSMLSRGASSVGRIGGNVAGALPLISAAGAGVGAAGLPTLGRAITSGGFSTGGPAVTGALNVAKDLGVRTLGGGTAGMLSAGAVNPEDAKTGAFIGALLPGAVKAAGALGAGARGLLTHGLGSTTGTSSETVKAAFDAGRNADKSFLDNMRGQVPFDDVVDAAKKGLQKMRADRGSAYRSGMVDIKNDKTILDMTPITKTTSEMLKSATFKGKAINEKSYETMREIADKVDDWARAPKADFHTPEGLDALKQAIGDIRDSTQFGTPARRAADNVYNAIKDQIKAQAPTYEKVMRDYAGSSKTLSEVEKALSLGEKSSNDTAIRKLQSLMRNNAQSNYGNRLKLSDILESQGGQNLRPAIAGQAMNSFLPRGMVGAMEKIAIPGAAMFANPSALALAPLTSPRLIGEAAYGAGLLANKAGKALASTPIGALSGVNNGALGAEGLLSNSLLRNALIQAGAN